MYNHPDYIAKQNKGQTLFTDSVWPLICEPLGADRLETVEGTPSGLHLDLMGIDHWIHYGKQKYGVGARVWSRSLRSFDQTYPFISVRRQTTRPMTEYHARVHTAMTNSPTSDLTVESFITETYIHVIWVRTKQLWQTYLDYYDTDYKFQTFTIGKNERQATFLMFDWPWLVDNQLVRGCIKHRRTK